MGTVTLYESRRQLMSYVPSLILAFVVLICIFVGSSALLFFLIAMVPAAVLLFIFVFSKRFYTRYLFTDKSFTIVVPLTGGKTVVPYHRLHKVRLMRDGVLGCPMLDIVTCQMQYGERVSYELRYDLNCLEDVTRAVDMMRRGGVAFEQADDTSTIDIQYKIFRSGEIDAAREYQHKYRRARWFYTLWMIGVFVHMLFWLLLDISEWVNVIAVVLSVVGAIGGTWVYYKKVLPRL